AIALSVVTTALTFSQFSTADRPSTTAITLAQRAVADALPPADETFGAQAAALEAVRGDLRLELALYASDGTLIATSRAPNTQTRRHDSLPDTALALPDGRIIAARVAFPDFEGPSGLFLTLASVALAGALAAYPLVRRLTGRLERLQETVEQIGDGSLSARAQVEGCDEIATLASSFNAAADRIEVLLNAHKTLLANASHELRTPLSRIRLGLEMFRETGDPNRLEGMTGDIAQLDDLIEEILTMSRIECAELDSDEPLDLLALVAEECAQFDIEVEGESAMMRGNRRLLQRMVRNLLTNAVIHGKPPVTVSVLPENGTVILMVQDGGAGIPVDERARVFDRFYRGSLSTGTEGHGLGLALVKQIAEKHGGSAAISSKYVSAVVVSLGSDA
ncbi:MAG: ATP-binding protein, partial [Pseudomonadota bacterium]